MLDKGAVAVPEREAKNVIVFLERNNAKVKVEKLSSEFLLWVYTKKLIFPNDFRFLIFLLGYG